MAKNNTNKQDCYVYIDIKSFNLPKVQRLSNSLTLFLRSLENTEQLNSIKLQASPGSESVNR